MPAFQTLLSDVADHVLTITLHRPDRLNAFTLQMADELVMAFDAADADDEVRAVIVTGSGRGFCAGADLGDGSQAFAENPAGGDGRAPRDSGGRVALRIFECHKPVIAAVNGPAVGIGATMLLPMDVRIAAQSARFGFVFARRGIVPEAASTWFLPRVVGISQAMEWVATGRVFDAQEALEGGLVKAVVPDGELLDHARALAREIADNAAPVSVAVSRRMLWTMLGADHPMVAHRSESAALAQRGREADAVEGVMAFLEKRPAHFPDRVGAGGEGVPDVLPPWANPAY
jgi:enoyl-CoA hydratase/carnithine racemase